MVIFNRVFQKSYENTTCQLESEGNSLVMLYAANILTTSESASVKLNISVFHYQLEDENFMWITNAIKPFFCSCMTFFSA